MANPTLPTTGVPPWQAYMITAPEIQLRGLPKAGTRYSYEHWQSMLPEIHLCSDGTFKSFRLCSEARHRMIVNICPECACTMHAVPEIYVGKRGDATAVKAHDLLFPSPPKPDAATINLVLRLLWYFIQENTPHPKEVHQEDKLCFWTQCKGSGSLIGCEHGGEDGSHCNGFGRDVVRSVTGGRASIHRETSSKKLWLIVGFLLASARSQEAWEKVLDLAVERGIWQPEQDELDLRGPTEGKGKAKEADPTPPQAFDELPKVWIDQTTLNTFIHNSEAFLLNEVGRRFNEVKTWKSAAKLDPVDEAWTRLDLGPGSATWTSLGFAAGVEENNRVNLWTMKGVIGSNVGSLKPRMERALGVMRESQGRAPARPQEGVGAAIQSEEPVAVKPSQKPKAEALEYIGAAHEEPLEQEPKQPERAKVDPDKPVPGPSAIRGKELWTPQTANWIREDHRQFHNLPKTFRRFLANKDNEQDINSLGLLFDQIDSIARDRVGRPPQTLGKDGPRNYPTLAGELADETNNESASKSTVQAPVVQVWKEDRSGLGQHTLVSQMQIPHADEMFKLAFDRKRKPDEEEGPKFIVRVNQGTPGEWTRTLVPLFLGEISDDAATLEWTSRGVGDRQEDEPASAESWSLEDVLASYALSSAVRSVLRKRASRLAERRPVISEPSDLADHLSRLQVQDEQGPSGNADSSEASVSERDSWSDVSSATDLDDIWEGDDDSISSLIDAWKQLSPGAELDVHERESDDSWRVIWSRTDDHDEAVINYFEIPAGRCTGIMTAVAHRVLALVDTGSSIEEFALGLTVFYDHLTHILADASVTDDQFRNAQGKQAQFAAVMADLICAPLRAGLPLVAQIRNMALVVVSILALVDSGGHDDDSTFTVVTIQAIIDRIPVDTTDSNRCLRPISQSALWFLNSWPSLMERTTQATVCGLLLGSA